MGFSRYQNVNFSSQRDNKRSIEQRTNKCKKSDRSLLLLWLFSLLNVVYIERILDLRICLHTRLQLLNIINQID